MKALSTILLAGAMLPGAAWAQNLESHAPSVSIAYSALRSNAGPGQCGCFFLNGGTGEISFPVARAFSIVADLSGQTGAGLNGSSNGLSVITYTAGPRLVLHRFGRFSPYAQVLGGGSYGFNTLFPTAQAKTSANGFAMLAGGGLNLRLSRTVSLQPAEVEYQLTGLPNGGSDTQNNLRLSAGVVYRFR